MRPLASWLCFAITIAVTTGLSHEFPDKRYIAACSGLAVTLLVILVSEICHALKTRETK